MEGPAFSTKAESNVYRSWGMDVIGMTNLQEAKLAREAEICYVTIAMVTDYDCWHAEHDAVTVNDIIANLMKNAENAAKVVAEAVARMPEARTANAGRRSRTPSSPIARWSPNPPEKIGSADWQILRVRTRLESCSDTACAAKPGPARC
jgi:hypothetical protein